MQSLPGEIREACEAYVPALSKRGTPQDREHNILTHIAGVLSPHHTEALYQACVGVWGPVGRDPALTGAAAAAADFYRAQSGAAVGPTVGGSGCGLPGIYGNYWVITLILKNMLIYPSVWRIMHYSRFP